MGRLSCSRFGYCRSSRMELSLKRREGCGAIYCAPNPSSSQISDLGTPSPGRKPRPVRVQAEPGEVCGRGDGQRNGLAFSAARDFYGTLPPSRGQEGGERHRVWRRSWKSRTHRVYTTVSWRTCRPSGVTKYRPGLVLRKAIQSPAGDQGTSPPPTPARATSSTSTTGVPPPKGALANSHFSPRCRRYAIQVPSGDQEGMCWSEVADRGAPGDRRPREKSRSRAAGCRRRRRPSDRLERIRAFPNGSSPRFLELPP